MDLFQVFHIISSCFVVLIIMAMVISLFRARKRQMTIQREIEAVLADSHQILKNMSRINAEISARVAAQEAQTEKEKKGEGYVQ